MGNSDIIFNFIETNSQVGQAEDPNQSAVSKKLEAERKKQLEAERKTKAQIERQIAQDRAEIEAFEREKAEKDIRARLRERIEYGATVQDRLDAQRQLKELDLLEKKNQEIINTYTQASEEIVSKINGGLNDWFKSIKGAGKEYADYVEKLEVGLIGSTKSYNSVSNKLEKIFSMNVFFSLDSAIKKTGEFVERGINYNLESRAAMAVFSEKIVKTFDALDANLLRLVRIQQRDSTQARLGMESILQSYLNANFQNSEYLHGLSDQVTAALIEAESSKSMSTESAVEWEYSIQKWLGSLNSVGVSDSTIQAFAQGLGYLGSGDVEALSQNSALQQLMALSISKGEGNKSYGDMLLNGMDVEDVNAVFTGFYNLVTEIGNQDNAVALNQYAKIFNMSVSDITSVLNLSSEQIRVISEDMKSYQQARSQVESELSNGKLFQRSSYSEMFDNVKKNMLTSIGLDMANSLVANLVYEFADQAANAVDMIDLGIEIDPFGVGASTKIDAGALIRGGVAGATYLVEFAKNITGLTSMLGPNLKLLEDDSSNSAIKLMGGNGTNSIQSGATSNQVKFVGNTETNSVLDTVKQSGDKTTSEILNKDMNEEEERMKKTQQAMQDIGDNVAFIVQLLNIDGIKIRNFPSSADDTGAIFSSNPLEQRGY